MKKILLVLLIIFANSILAQDIQMDNLKKTKKFSFGVKVGAPNILSVNGEFVLPILNNHFAPYIDYGSFNLDIDNTSVRLNLLWGDTSRT